MSEKNTLFYRLISNPINYTAIQNVVFGKSCFNQKISNDYIRPFDDMNLLDIGCGPSDVLSILLKKNQIKYTGIDASKCNIEAAISRFGNRDQFYHGYVTEQSCINL